MIFCSRLQGSQEEERGLVKKIMAQLFLVKLLALASERKFTVTAVRLE